MKTINLKSGEYEITLLTQEEYEQYADRIPLLTDWWWLRSPGFKSYITVVVDGFGLVNAISYNINDFYVGMRMRPVLRTPDISHLSIGDSFIALGNRWIVIDNAMAISQDIISYRRYNTKNNVWETSELKMWLTE